MSSPNNWQEEAMRRLRQMQQQGGRGGFPGGPQMPKGAGGMLAAAVLLGGGGLVLANSLFNVDGGQRAIKYRRISGVSKEIYAEGKMPLHSPSPFALIPLQTTIHSPERRVVFFLRLTRVPE